MDDRTYTYADLYDDLLRGRFPLKSPSTWAVALDVLRSALDASLETEAVDFTVFSDRFPVSGPTVEYAPRSPSGSVYRRWHSNMITLHRLGCGTGNAWADLIAIGNIYKASGVYVGNVTDLRASLRVAGLQGLHPTEISRSVVLEANENLQQAHRIRFRAACTALDKLRDQDLIQTLGLLRPEPIGTLPKRTKCGTMLVALPASLECFLHGPVLFRDAVRAVFHSAVRVGAVNVIDAQPRELLDAVLSNAAIGEEMRTRMTASSVVQYRQRAIRALTALERSSSVSENCAEPHVPHSPARFAL